MFKGIDLTNKKIGKLHIISYSHSNRSNYWNCICDCGRKKIMRGSAINAGIIKSCGCINGRYHNSLRHALERNFKRIDKSECWEWKGSIHSRGYGKFRYSDKTYKAHRVSYELYVGNIEEGLMICHKCHNKKCVNPNHLYAGTAQDNANDNKKDG